MDDLVDGLSEVTCDVLVIGGGTAGPMAALKAKLKNPNATVILLEKANVKRSGAISMGMDGLNNAVIPGHATPEQYTKEITIANDGIVDQKPVYKYAQRCYSIIEELDSFGIRFLKNENGDFAVKKVHHIGTYVLPMPNGETVKKALYRQLRRAADLQSLHGDAALDRQKRSGRGSHCGQHPHRRVPRYQGQGGHSLHGRRRPARPADVWLYVRHL
jgi:succinate dehydrogenase/fumarate reductase flavoprotein subunit